MKMLKTIGLILGIGYFLVCVVVYFIQDRFIFLPDKLPANYLFENGEEIKVEVEKGIALSCLWMKEPQSKGVILYLHGNKGTNRRCWHQAQNMGGNDYDIFMPDYRGYGKSDGEIYSETQLFSDAQVVYDFLKKHYKEEQIIIAGYSLGSGIAAYLAANNRPQQLVMVAPYASFYDLKQRFVPYVFPDFLVKYPLDSEMNLQKVECPVTLFHGTNDEIIPFDCSKKLEAINPGNIELIVLEDEGHRGAMFNGLFRRKFSELAVKGAK